MTKLARAFAPFVKTEKNADGTVTVFGKATGPDLDSDLQICDPDWLAKAMPAWMQWGNVREMHSPKAAGVATSLEQNGDDWLVSSLIVEPTSVAKVETGVLKGYSIGIARPVVVKDVSAPGGRIVGGNIVELSLVDRPANPTCALTIAKAAGDQLVKVDDPMLGDGYEVDDETNDETSEEASEDDPSSGPGPDAASDPVALLGEAKRCIALVLASCAADVAAEPVEESGSKVWLLRRIAELLDELDWTQSDLAYLSAVERLEEAYKAIFPATTPDPEEVTTVNIADVLEAVKAATAPDAPEADTLAVVELRKALNPDSQDPAPDVLTKATKAAEEISDLKAKVAEVTAELAATKAALAEVSETVLSAGPVRIRPAEDLSKSARLDELETAAQRLESIAGTVTDPSLADGYRQLAAEKRAEAHLVKAG